MTKRYLTKDTPIGTRLRYGQASVGYYTGRTKEDDATGRVYYGVEAEDTYCGVRRWVRTAEIIDPLTGPATPQQERFAEQAAAATPAPEAEAAPEPPRRRSIMERVVELGAVPTQAHVDALIAANRRSIHRNPPRLPGH